MHQTMGLACLVTVGLDSNPAFLGAQGKTVLDPDFDIDDGG